MNEKARPVSEIAPEVSSETDEIVTDAFIDELLLHREANQQVLALLEDVSGPCRDRLARIELISPFIDEFLTTVDDTFQEGEGGRRMIREALALSLKVHINQADRVATQLPFAGHPISVAQRVLETYKGPDLAHVVSAALLHDSVEDQSRLLKLEKKIGTKKGISAKQLEREGALHGLGHIFGPRVQLLVQSVTSPHILKTDISQQRKNEVYKEYVQDIFSYESISAASAVIKWADLQENALTLDELRERVLFEELNENDEAAQKAQILYTKLREKYEPVLRIVSEFFEHLTDENHPLFSQKDEALSSISSALEYEYSRG